MQEMTMKGLGFAALVAAVAIVGSAPVATSQRSAAVECQQALDIMMEAWADAQSRSDACAAGDAGRCGRYAAVNTD
jgi:hypothetical protein